MLANRRHIDELQDSPLKKALTYDHIKTIDTFCNENSLGLLSYEAYCDKPGLYLMIIGLYKGEILMKFGESDNLRNRIKQHFEYDKYASDDFKPYVRLIHAKEAISHQHAEQELKRTLGTRGIRVLDLYIKSSSKKDTELILLHSAAGIDDVITLIDNAASGADSMIQQQVMVVSDFESDYQSRKLNYDYELAMKREETKQLEFSTTNRRLELEIELLKLKIEHGLI